ncbi:MAG: ABC transporter ATP-binding protein [Pseudomonadota bacterium]|nr:ABC transporter ATP-binding protein [Pseudomonadota bacterium]
MDAALLEVRDLKVVFDTADGTTHAVRGVSLSVRAGETLAVVGESGCGKSVSFQSLLGLTPTPPGRILDGSAVFNGQTLIENGTLAASVQRGRDIGMIFQDPMASMNPTMRIGDQIAEPLRIHQGLSRRAAHQRAIQLLQQVRIPEPASRVHQYPFEFSGGMLQRAMIAMALGVQPKLLIADEPTTALDVTIQAQILDLLRGMKAGNNMAMVLITHDLGVVAETADRVAVMYAGEVVESTDVESAFERPAHPYTLGLRQSIPDPGAAAGGLTTIPGTPPDLSQPIAGCAYAPRCPYAMRVCAQQAPPPFDLPVDEHGLRRWSRCWLQHPKAPRIKALDQSARGVGDGVA